jgi:hypothetical protein
MPHTHRTDVEDWFKVMDGVDFDGISTPILSAPFPVNMHHNENNRAAANFDVIKELWTRIPCDGFYLRLKVVGGDVAAINIQLDIHNLWYPLVAKIDTDAVTGFLLPVNGVATWRRVIDVEQGAAGTASLLKFTRLDANTGDFAVHAWIKRYRHMT